jgi:hypothetical protein
MVLGQAATLVLIGSALGGGYDARHRFPFLEVRHPLAS